MRTDARAQNLAPKSQTRHKEGKTTKPFRGRFLSCRVSLTMANHENIENSLSNNLDIASTIVTKLVLFWQILNIPFQSEIRIYSRDSGIFLGIFLFRNFSVSHQKLMNCPLMNIVLTQRW
jgi:hypothetical protein